MKIGLKTGAGHIASSMTIVDRLCDIYNKNNSAFVIISKGHGVLAQYVILNELGKLPNKVLDTYYQDGGLSEHSTLHPKYGIYASTGSLGHGLGIGIGYAIAYPRKRIYVIMSDGELDEGSTMESLRIIRKLSIRNVWPIVDINDWQAFSKFDPESMKMNYIKTYSIKGEGWGKLENTLESHYAKVDKKLYKLWKKNTLSKLSKKKND